MLLEGSETPGCAVEAPTPFYTETLSALSTRWQSLSAPGGSRREGLEARHAACFLKTPLPEPVLLSAWLRFPLMQTSGRQGSKW